MNDETFLGKGVALECDVDETGALMMSSLQELVKESLFIILSTKIGERVMNYNFGCQIHELMFALNTPATHARAKMYVDQAIRQWEPRVEVTNIEVEAVAKNEITIDVSYFIVEENIVDNLVYPFYLLEAK